MRTQELFQYNETSPSLLLCVYSPNGLADWVNINGTNVRLNSRGGNMVVNALTDGRREMNYVSVTIDNATLNENYEGCLNSGSGEKLEFSFIYRTG